MAANRLPRVIDGRDDPRLFGPLDGPPLNGPGDGAALMVVFSSVGFAPAVVEPDPRGGLLVRVPTDATRFDSNADVIAELLEEGPAVVLADIGAQDGVWFWDLDTDTMVLSAPACALLDLPVPAGRVSSSELLDCLESDDHTPLLLAAVGAVTSGRIVDVRVSMRGGFDSPRLRIVAQRAEGGGRMLEGVIRAAGRV